MRKGRIRKGDMGKGKLRLFEGEMGKGEMRKGEMSVNLNFAWSGGGHLEIQYGSYLTSYLMTPSD